MASKTQRKITEEQLRHLYLDRGLTDKEIADKLDCTKQAVYQARKRFSIGKLSQTERNTKLIKITKRQEGILRGSLLGDAYLGPDGSFDIQHGPKQHGYLTWLFKNLQPYFGDIRNIRTCSRIRSCPHKFGLGLRKEYYPKGKKVVTRSILDKLSPLSLAVWFMDDGQVLPSGKQSRISTCFFTEEEHEIMCEYFQEAWGIKPTISKSQDRLQLCFDLENTQRLMFLIAGHVPVSMRYKIRPAVNLSMYLSGGMEFKKNLGGPWRAWLTSRLAEQGISVLDPVKIEMPYSDEVPIQEQLTRFKNEGDLDAVRKITRESLFRKDMSAIQLADATIVLYDESAQRGAGTLSEAWESFREARPVYLVTDFPLEKIPTWLIGESTAIFADFDELLAYTKDCKILVRDIVNAQRIRDEVLNDIY